MVPSINDDDDYDAAVATAATASAPVNNVKKSKVKTTSSRKIKRERDDDEDEEAAIPNKKAKASDVVHSSASTSAMKPKKVPVDDFYMREMNKPDTNDKACRVYQHDGIVYDATLNQTQAGMNANKFYRIQLLQYDNGNFYTWTRWGRVGENGQFKKLGNGSLAPALSEFEKKYKDKTGNKWDDRDSFVAKSNKYTLIEINYEDSDDDDNEGEGLPGVGARRQSKDSIESSASSEVVSKLPKPVANLMSFIFDQNYFNSTLADLNYDPEKMPLGKLSKKTLLQGYEVLKQLASLIGAPSNGIQIEALSNQYFSLIPHAFGRNRPPVLSQIDMIKKEIEVLENLTDMQLANDIMKTAKTANKAEKLALADRQYQGLGLEEMTPLSPASMEYKELADYLIKSAGQTHYLNYKVQDIFRIERGEDTDRFAKSEFSKFKKGQTDRRLLWHGSRSTNFGGILSQGLRIAPPEAPVSGYMFGKGIYLADISTKSANYCNSFSSGNTGLLLLCEAELGKPSLKLTDADSGAGSRAKKENCISTWGVGQTTPAGWKDAGCVHPSLKGVSMPDISTAPGDSGEGDAWLQYDEFICYDIAQVKLRYLVRTAM